MKHYFVISSFLFSFNTAFGQTYLHDNNNQIIGLLYGNGTTITIQYDENGNRVSYNVSGGPLPVTLLSYNAQKSGEQVLLTWSTSTEINTDKFDVEYSKDGTSFSSFTTIAANGNSSTRINYSTIHCCPIEGVNFYRLKMIDKDGSFKYSEIRKVVFEFENVMTLFPNPNTQKSNLNISFKKPFFKDGRINIYNAMGALVYSSILTKGQTTKQIITGNFAAGDYSVIVEVDGVRYNDNFIKQ